MKNLLIITFTALYVNAVIAQGPEVTSWQINTNGNIGFAGELTNVQSVQYSANYVYISTTDIASWIPVGYNWPNNPWFPQNMNYVFKIYRNPVPNIGPVTACPYGHIGIWLNGISFYNPQDAKSFDSLGIWNQNAYYWEHLIGETFDTCWGHPNGSHEYHTHVSPACLYNDADSLNHSPIIGYAFDGYPVYGAYGYTNTNGTGAVKRMKSSYRMRNITDRTVLPDGTVLSVPQYGPRLDSIPLGAYMEDFEFVNGLGDLDIHNGRFCITPEYPAGTYAYFVTIDAQLTPVFPYVLGPTYYGNVIGPDGNLGPNSGHVVISEPVTIYNSTTAIKESESIINLDVFPNPASNQLSFQLSSNNSSLELTANIYNQLGEVVETGIIKTGIIYTYDTSRLKSGIYYFKVVTEQKIYNTKFVITK